MVSTVAGGGTYLPTNEMAAKDAALLGPWGVAADPEGKAVYFSDVGLNQVWKLALPPLEKSEEIVVPSPDGSVLYVFDAEGRHLRTEDSVTRQALWTFSYTAYTGPGGEPTQLLTTVEDAFGNVVTIERGGGGEPIAIDSADGQRTSLVVNGQTGYLQEVSRQLEGGEERVQLVTGESGLLESLVTPKGQTYSYDYDEDGRLIQVSDPEQGRLDLDFLETEDGHTVTQTTAESVESSTELSVLEDDEIHQTVVLPSGLEARVERRQDGSLFSRYPDGAEMTVETKPDPRLGAKSPVVVRSRLETPVDHLEQVVERTRSVTVDGIDPLTLATQTDTVVTNGRPSTSTWVASTQTLTTTSPEGRSGETIFDTFGRVSEVHEPGIEPVMMSYDGRGRLEVVRQGSGANERTMSVTYDGAGFVETVTDPLQRVTRYEHDAVGRVVKTILPDQREIGFAYDQNGNLTHVTPPSRPDHIFDHNDVDQMASYAPPDLDPGTPEVPATTYGYDLDHRLVTITRPDSKQVVVHYDGALPHSSWKSDGVGW